MADFRWAGKIPASTLPANVFFYIFLSALISFHKLCIEKHIQALNKIKALTLRYTQEICVFCELFYRAVVYITNVMKTNHA
jgi:hypothetical protein